MKKIQHIGVLAHPLRPQSYPIAQQIYHTLKVNYPDTWIYTNWVYEDVIDDIAHTDMVIAIGGDGAMLRAARVCAIHDVPVLGVNKGNLGFLTEIATPENWQLAISKVFEDDYWIEKRAMVQVTITRNGEEIIRGDALNDIVISGNAFGHMVRLDIFIDGDWVTNYSADALVVATATGSTAYALSVGGPILPPELTNFLVIPSAPHLSMGRPIVLPKDAKLEVTPADDNAATIIVSTDGATLYRLEPDDRIQIQISNLVSRFIRLRGRNYFYRSLLDRLEPRNQRMRNNHD